MNEETASESDGSLGQTALVPAANADILKAFDGPRAEIAKWAATAATIKITDASQTREMRMAKESRLALVKVRTRAETVKKGLKEDILARGKAIDSAYNELVSLIKPIEATLLEQETYGERLEAERQARVKAQREAILHQLEVHPAAFPSNLGAMVDDDWAAVQSGHALALEGKRAAEKAAEEARVLREKAEAEARALKEKAEAEERARVEEERRLQAEENARLKKEAEAREAQMLVERERVEALIRAVEEEARIDRERIEAARVAAEAVANEEREKAEAERRAELARIEAERQAERDKAMAEVRRLAAEHQAEQEKVEALRRAEQEKAEATLAEARRLFESEKAAMDRTAAAEAEARKPTRAKYAAMVTALRRIRDEASSLDGPMAAAVAAEALVAVGEA